MVKEALRWWCEPVRRPNGHCLRSVEPGTRPRSGEERRGAGVRKSRWIAVRPEKQGKKHETYQRRGHGPGIRTVCGRATIALLQCRSRRLPSATENRGSVSETKMREKASKDVPGSSLSFWQMNGKGARSIVELRIMSSVEPVT